MTREPRLTLLPLVGATYFMVSGGAYGLEELVAFGYGAAAVVLVVTPIVWSLPTALMVGELASAVPEEGGYYAWVRRAMGPFWGFQEAWLSLAASVFDMAIYPTLFTLYVGRLMPVFADGPARLALGAAMIAACAAWNVRGASGVGSASIVLTALLLAPFVFFSLAALLGPHPSALNPASDATPHDGILAGVLVAMWNYMGWDNASTIATEVDCPRRTYPLAMLATVGLVAATYLVPVGAAAYAGLDPGRFTTGAWVDAARAVGGPWLGCAVVFGGMICGVGMFNALLLSYSRLPLALAEDGYFPRWLAVRHPRTGAPWASIVLCSLAYAACLGIGFLRLVELDVLLYGVSLLLEFAALVALRVREPGLLRPFKIPGGVIGAALTGVGPLVLLATALWVGRNEKVGSVPALAVGGVVVAMGPVLYALAPRRRVTGRAGTGASTPEG